MPTETNLQLNSCQAKDKPPRPLRSERSRKADGTASSRIACQESTLWQCRQQIQFDVTLFKAHKPLCMHPLSDERSAGNYITNHIFGLIKRDRKGGQMLIEIKAGQFRKISRLVRRACGNCLLLDDGETHTCVQLISKYHIFCNHFKDAVLPLDKELYRVLICDNDYKRCQSCGSRFYSKARNKRYCDKCAERIKRQKAAERKRRQRERQKQLLYINN